MRILAIDYGEKRIGLAVGDTENKIVFPRGILNNSAQIYNELKNFCKKERIDKIIVGLPISLSGKDSTQTKQTREFALQLERELRLSIKLIDERLTSVQAQKLHPERENIDDIAALLLLEQYFQSNKI